MASSSGGLDLDVSNLVEGVVKFDMHVRKAVGATMLFHSQSALSYARQNAPWTDRTGNARNGLFVTTDFRDSPGRGKYTIILGHSVPYGIWLETRWSGRYAIIAPTIQREAGLIVATLGRVL